MSDNTQDSHQLHIELSYRRKLHEIGNRVNAAAGLDDILIHLINDITDLFEAERATLYVVDGAKRKLVSRVKTGSDINEIRVPISADSIAGFSAFKQRLVNLEDVYDQAALSAVDPDLRFDRRWDQKTGFRTRQILANPVIYKNYLMGVIQLINCRSDRQNGGHFQGVDEDTIVELSEILGIALYNQRRLAAVKTTKFDHLVENRLVTNQEIDKAVITARKSGESIEEILMDNYRIPKKEIGASYSRFFQVPFIQYNSHTPIPGDLMSGLKVSFMRNNSWVPIKTEEDRVMIAIDNPSDLYRIDMIKSLFKGRKLDFYVAFKRDIERYIKLFSDDEQALAGIDEIISQLVDEADEVEEAEKSLGESDSAVVQLVNKIILEADNRGASDIHIEPYPGKDNTRVRIRVDGNCYLYQTIPYLYRNAVAARIKIMSGLDIAERRKPQDGKIKFKQFGGRDIELRVATVPTQGGLEDVVMRLLSSGEPIPLDDMHFSTSNYQNFINAVEKPYGIIFVCGPTGSGKTTTLHSALRHINKTETKIWTAEDPVEITQAGLRQVQVHGKIGFDFASAMRAFLRADPDVIMVGEMRDKETVRIGIEASLTGHLVFSTLHTNSAPESITRLLDMGMDPFNFADAILCILSQRLVLTLCKKCKEAYHPNREEYDELVRSYGEKEFKDNKRPPYTDDLKLYRPKGCEACNGTGYKGRLALHELLTGTDDIKRLIQNKARMEELRTQAMKDGMTTLKQDGIEKIFSGHCDLLQVRKVTIK